MNNKEIIKSNNNTLRKVKNFPSATSIWNNSIYSFNQNYLKNIPAVDNIVNKLIKSFFSINALANNPKGNKSKLIQRRYKRLSLNKILVSKSEIKHNNDKVFITVYLFNKKKKSLLLKLRNLGQSLGISSNSLPLDNKNNALLNNIGIENQSISSNLNTNSIYKAFKGEFYKSHNEVTSESNKYDISQNMIFNANTGSKYRTLSYKLKLLKGINNTKLDTNSNLFNNISLNKYVATNRLSNTENNAYAIPYLSNSVSNIMKNNKFFDKSAQSLLNLKAISPERNTLENNVVDSYTIANTNSLDVNSTVLYYKNLNFITKYNIHMFTKHLLGGEALASNKNAEVIKSNGLKDTDLRNYFKSMNKYKLFNSISANTNFETDVVKHGITKYNYLNGVNIKPNYSVYKLKSMNKLFTLYNNINLGLGAEKSLHSNKMLLNTYKLLKKSYTVLSSNLAKSNTHITTDQETSSLNAYNIAYMTRKDLSGLGNKNVKSSTLGRNSSYVIKGLSSNNGNNKSYISLKKSMRNIILINKLNRIDRFFDKYKETLISQSKSNGMVKVNSLMENSSLNNIINNYKVNFISELMEKELLYIYYLKLLSYNDIVFKNWFLYSLKNLISKIYNKKVVFNLVNLKYIHLNSDILAQAVNIRLRNFKKNRVVNVLKKVIKLVPISKVNIYACDEHSSIYKYVNNYHNKFRNLKLDIFKELGVGNNSSDKATYTGPRRNGALKKLNHIQANTINFIKYKSAFGVRLEAAGRLTKRSTASRSIFKYRYNGTLRNNAIINNNISSVIIKDNRISNLQFTQVSSKTRNGSFGLKGWINNN